MVSLLTGEPEYLDPLKDDAPDDWNVTGYPYTQIDTPEHKAFLAAYQKKYNDYPRLNSVVGYATVKALAAGIPKAGSTDTEALVRLQGSGVQLALRPGGVPAPGQPVDAGHLRRPHRRQGRKGRHAVRRLSRRRKLQPSDEEIRKRRPADTQ